MIKGIYVIPYQYYLATITLSLDQRIKLLSLERKYNFVILEDNYDYEFHYSLGSIFIMASYNHYGPVYMCRKFIEMFFACVEASIYCKSQSFSLCCFPNRKNHWYIQRCAGRELFCSFI